MQPSCLATCKRRLRCFRCAVARCAKGVDCVVGGCSRDRRVALAPHGAAGKAGPRPEAPHFAWVLANVVREREDEAHPDAHQQDVPKAAHCKRAKKKKKQGQHGTGGDS